MPNDCAAGPWRSMKTAPRDGTDVLLYCYGPYEPMFAVGYWDHVAKEWITSCCATTPENKAIAWAPLHVPGPDEAKPGSAEGRVPGTGVGG